MNQNHAYDELGMHNIYGTATAIDAKKTRK